MYVCTYEYVQNSKSTQQRILVITSPLLISHYAYAAFVDVVVVIQPRLPAYGIRNNVLCYGVRACTYGGGGHEGYVMYIVPYNNNDTNPYARVINNKLTTIFIKLIPANLAPCHLTRGDQRTHGTACLRPLPPT